MRRLFPSLSRPRRLAPAASRKTRPDRGVLPEVLESRRLLSGNVTMFHNDPAGTGVNANETQLTPGNVNVAQFGKHWSTPMDGQVYAQPLYVSGQNITTGAGAGVHNVAYVATEHDSVYAVDGDSGSVLWKTSVLGAGETTMPAGETGSGFPSLVDIGNILKRANGSREAAAGPASPESVRFGPFVFRLDRGELRRESEIVRITEREREILTILGHRAGANVPREELAGGGEGLNERTVDVQINRLRRKIEVDPANPVYLQTVRGVGYRLLVD